MGEQIPMVDYLVLNDNPHLEANRCDDCGALYFDRRNACAKCGKEKFSRVPLASEGSLRSYTIVHRAAPGVPTPFVSAIVDLDGGGVVKANLIDVDPDPAQIKVGERVKMTTFVAGTDDDGTEAVAFGYSPANS